VLVIYLISVPKTKAGRSRWRDSRNLTSTVPFFMQRGPVRRLTELRLHEKRRRFITSRGGCMVHPMAKVPHISNGDDLGDERTILKGKDFDQNSNISLRS
jgi:hypothetical protein